MEPTTKRIKLSLEPFIEKTVVDITDTGHEVLKNDLSLPEQLMRDVDRVWYERGDWKDITEEQLRQQLTSGDNNKDTNTATDAEANTFEGEQQLQKLDEKDNKLRSDEDDNTVDLGKLRDSVISKLHFAKCEIDVALDVINILATENKPNTTNAGGVGGVLAGINGATGGLNSMINNGLSENTGGNNNLILPPGALHATYVSKPKLTEKAQLEQAQLTLGLKRTQQKTAADYLKKSAASLKKLVTQEQVFWDEAVRVRSNHWLMQASRGDSGFFINYGFADVGSDFGEVSYGEMSRSEEVETCNDQPQVLLSLPHNTPKQVRVSIRRNQLGQLGARSGEVLGLGSTKKEKDETGIQDVCPTLHKVHDSSIQRRLIDAQSTVYDAELFSRILSEAQVIPNNIQCEEDCVIVTLDGQVDILIQKSQYDQQQHGQHKPDISTVITSTEQLSGQTIEIALRLLLIQRHRLNLWKSRTRLMSGQRKTQQLLNSMGDTTILPGSASGTAGSTTLINNTMAAGPGGPGSNGSKNATAGGGVGGGSSTPIITHRTTVNTSTTSGGPSSSSLSSSSMARQLTGGGSHLSSREPYPEVPLLSPVISMTRFWILFDRIRDVVHNAVDPLCGETGLGLTVHFKPQHVFNNAPHGYCDAYPGFGELTSSLAINLFKGPSLRFALNQSGTIIATSPGNVVTLANVTEFESYLLREINLICLHQVCDIANNLIKRSSAYQSAKNTERESYIWQVDEVEEILYGAVNTTKKTDSNQIPIWKTIQVQLNQTKINQNMPAYVLQFKEDTLPTNNQEQHRSRHQIKRFILLSQWQNVDMDTIKCSVTFRDKVAMMVEQLLE
ncbi:subunit 17 of mediator complex-domain-containing protein [Chlamydoabsidia padenii]|nr:subunit 17 of mediator complex-domain-containing protein [Chlamydoabsidia padenii]